MADDKKNDVKNLVQDSPEKPPTKQTGPRELGEVKIHSDRQQGGVTNINFGKSAHGQTPTSINQRIVEAMLQTVTDCYMLNLGTTAETQTLTNHRAKLASRMQTDLSNLTNSETHKAIDYLLREHGKQVSQVKDQLKNFEHMQKSISVIFKSRDYLFNAIQTLDANHPELRSQISTIKQLKATVMEQWSEISTLLKWNKL